MALVTGSRKGVTHATVMELATSRSHMHMSTQNSVELELCRRRWAEKGLQVTISVCDVTVPAEHEPLIDTVMTTFDGKSISWFFFFFFFF